VVGDGDLCAVAHFGQIPTEVVPQLTNPGFHCAQYGALLLTNLATIRDFLTCHVASTTDGSTLRADLGECLNVLRR
jgi:hypothetical protein